MVGEVSRLLRTARTLERRSPPRKGLPTLWFVTDPDRTPDPLPVARRLPRGAGVIFRGFGREGAEETAFALAKVARAHGLVLLIGADERLAARAGAAGVHLPERMVSRARLIRMRHPGWVVTAAAHSVRAGRAAKVAGADMVLLSAVFDSRSPSAGHAMGPVRLALAGGAMGGRVIALGGVNGRTAPRLAGTGVYGMASVDGLAALAGDPKT